MEVGDFSCELTRKSNMICPTTCGCWISLQDIMGKPHLVSHTLRAQRKFLKNNLIACFGNTADITNKDDITNLKRAQNFRNSDIYRSSIQYIVQGRIHGKEVFLVPPQDAILLLQDHLYIKLWKKLKKRNGIEGLGPLATTIELPTLASSETPPDPKDTQTATEPDHGKKETEETDDIGYPDSEVDEMERTLQDSAATEQQKKTSTPYNDIRTWFTKHGQHLLPQCHPTMPFDH